MAFLFVVTAIVFAMSLIVSAFVTAMFFPAYFPWMPLAFGIALGVDGMIFINLAGMTKQ